MFQSVRKEDERKWRVWIFLFKCMTWHAPPYLCHVAAPHLLLGNFSNDGWAIHGATGSALARLWPQHQASLGRRGGIPTSFRGDESQLLKVMGRGRGTGGGVHAHMHTYTHTHRYNTEVVHIILLIHNWLKLSFMDYTNRRGRVHTLITIL